MVVVGRGPASYAAALGARSRGLHVTIIGVEDQIPHWGETLPATCLPLLSRLGLADELRNPAHLESHGHLSMWGDDRPHERVGLSNAYGPSVILDGPRFLRRLEDTFRAGGGHVIDRRSSDIRRTRDGFALILDGTPAEHCLQARALVDATGAAARVSRRLGATRSLWARQVAFGACYEARAPDVELPAVTLLEAVEHGWLYAAPLPNHRRAVIWWVTDRNLFPPEATPPATRVMAQVRQSIEMSSWTREWHLQETEPGFARNASVGGLDHATGEGWVAVGDAALTLDPLSSSGIALALLSGLHGGTALAASLTGEPAALTSYVQMLAQAQQHHLAQRTGFHRIEARWPDSQFWKRRATAPTNDPAVRQ